MPHVYDFFNHPRIEPKHAGNKNMNGWRNV